MRKLLWIVLVALMAAAAIWYGLRVAEKSATVAVTSLLPGDTLLVVHLPDFNQTRDQFHQTDIYKIRQEPAVRDFLQKPLSKIPKSETASQKLAEFESLEPKDIFFAVTSWTNDLKLAGGFRFKGKAEDAEKVLWQVAGDAAGEIAGSEKRSGGISATSNPDDRRRRDRCSRLFMTRIGFSWQTMWRS